METAAIFAPILVKERQSDGTLLVTGVATDDTLDIDQQIADPQWLERAMPAWFKYGNIREQHSNIAAGVATELVQSGSQHIVTARVVDPGSVKKVESGVLKGFSIGIRNPRVASDKAAPGGRIVDGEIVEVSLVDRPANPSCMIELAKTVGGIVEQVETLVEPDQVEVVEETDAVKGGGFMERCKACGAMKKAKKLSSERMCKACKKGIVKADNVDEVSGEGSGMGYPMGGGSESSSGMEGEEPEGESPAHVEEEMVILNSMMDKIDALSAAFARIEEMFGMQGKSAKVTDKINELDERVTKVEKSATRGPVRTAVVPQTVVSDDRAAKAAMYRAKAAEATDRALADGYLLLAAKAETV